MTARKPKSFTENDLTLARKEWEKENPGKDWEQLTTQTKNRLARQQVFHREYHELSAAMMKVRR